MMIRARTGTMSSLAFAGMLYGGAAFAQESTAPARDAAPPGGAGTVTSGTPAAETAAQAVAEIIVTGSRLANSGFSAPTPVAIVGSDLIQRQAVTNIADALNQVPSFRPQSSRATGGVFAANLGAQTADLRGLGANRTLVLVDGRRFVASTVQGGGFTPGGAVDLSLIPTSLIDRTEVVTGGASAAYGSDAVAGVVNIILNDNLQGIKGQVQSGISSRGDGSEYSVSLTGGTGFAGGRGHIVVAGEYIDAKAVGDCYSRSWCANGAGNIQNATPGVNGYPAINLLTNPRTANSAPGGLINSGPLAGQTFDANGTLFKYPRGVYLGAGLFQSGGGTTQYNDFYTNFPLVVPSRRYNLFGHVKYDLTSNVQAFAELSYGHVEGTSVQSQIRETALTINVDNAYLTPAQRAALGTTTSFSFGRIGNDLGPTISTVKRGTLHAATGLKGNFDEGLLSGWKWDASYEYGRTDYHQRTSNDKINANFTRAIDAVVNPATGQIVCRSTLSANPATAAAAAGCQPLNLFGENRFSAAAKTYIMGTAMQDTRLQQHVAAFNIDGPIFNTWAGPVTVATGGEYRREKVSGSSDPISAVNGFYASNGAAVNGSVEVAEAYVETGVPLAHDVAWAYRLDLNGAVRYTHYNTTGGATTWKVGAVYEPVRGLRLRVTRSRDIRAPNLFELYSPLIASFAAIRDPATNRQVLGQVLSGGNTNLKNEVADTFTGGVVIEPRGFLSGLHLSVDYFDIKVASVITSLGAQIIVNRCAAGAADACALIARDASGNILSVTNPYLNLNRLRSRGIDFEGSYRLPLNRISSGASGSINFAVSATYTADLATTDISGLSINRAGMNGSPNGQTSGLPDWSVNGQITYDNGPLSLTAQVRYINGGVYDPTLLGPEDAGYSPTLSNSITTNRVPSVTYVNLQARYDVVNDGQHKVQFYGVVNNLFDKDPPNLYPSAYGPGNPILYDVVGRAFRVGVRFSY
jgi:outer membrane receptor protein involved in Fe transport